MPLQDPDDDIRGEMQVIPISKTSRYVALSYSWGMDEDGNVSISRSIAIDGKRLGVTRNLYDGLRRICSNGRPLLPLWIDAISIDQSNISERNDQVGRMAEVYSNATRVFVWLGEGSGDADNAALATVLECLRTSRHQHYHEHVVVTHQGDTAKICLVNAGLAAHRALERNLPSHLTPCYDEPLMALPEQFRLLFDYEDVFLAIEVFESVLLRFSTKRYWHRRWILQEIFHANHDETYLLWGVHVMRMQHLKKSLHQTTTVWNWLSVQKALSSKRIDTRKDVPDAFSRCHNLVQLEQMLTLRKWASDPHRVHESLLAEILAASGDLECSDPRDVVFALLSMDPNTLLRANYNLATAEVYMSFCKELLKDDLLLPSMLRLAAQHIVLRRFDDPITASLPSWCLDLRSRLGLAQSRPTWGPHWVDDSGRLTCSAFVIGTLAGDLVSIIASQSWVAQQETQPAKRLNPFDTWEAQRRRTGDLVCAFHTPGETRPGMVWFEAIILQTTRDNSSEYRIVGEGYLEIEGTMTSWPVETVCIR